MVRLFIRVWAAALLLMSFSYGAGSNPQIDYPRFLSSDTVATDASGQRVYAFEDSEIVMAYNIEAGNWQSGMFYSGVAGLTTFPSIPVSYRRVAANLLDALASNQARLSILSQLLDVKLNANAVKDMQAQAKALRDIDDNSGAFVIIEQVNDVFSFKDRYWKTIQRQAIA